MTRWFKPLDLTDLDWSPDIWILCHDKDELNARLARKLWDENGLDVAEGFVEPLLAFFGKWRRSFETVSNYTCF